MSKALDTLQAMAQSMVNSPANAVQLAPQLSEAVSQLPRPHAELVTRPEFERAGLWTLGVTFENLPNDGQPSTQVIELQRDLHIRGVNATALIQLTDPEDFDLPEETWLFSQAGFKNLRFLFEVNWTIDDERGFITTGVAETRARGTAVTGDGEFSAALDWKLQRNQTISVRAASLFPRIFPEAVEEDTAILRWLTVCFWAEEIRQPGV